MTENTEENKEIKASKKRGRPILKHNALKTAHPLSAVQENPTYRSPLKAPDILAIGNKDPNRVYRWLSKTLFDKNGGLDRRGWEPINAENSHGECLISEWGATTSGTELRVGDAIVGWMSKERAAIRKQVLRSANEGLKVTVNTLRRQVAEAGGEITGDVTFQRDGIVEKF